jgi:hypothetical protein
MRGKGIRSNIWRPVIKGVEALKIVEISGMEALKA